MSTTVLSLGKETMNQGFKELAKLQKELIPDIEISDWIVDLRSDHIILFVVYYLDIKIIVTKYTNRP